MRKVKQRDAYEIITLGGCFHGRTFGALAATGRESLSDGFTPLPEGFKQVPANDLAALEAAITPATAAVLVEVVQGEGGIVPLPGDYLRGVEALCRKHDILFICDEVQAGLCRTGTFWAFQQHGLTPDAISMAKSLANGLPMGAMLATDEMARGFEAGSHATTFGGGALASGVAAKCVEIMLRDKLADRAAELGKHVMDRVRAIQDKLPGTVREVRGLAPAACPDHRQGRPRRLHRYAGRHPAHGEVRRRFPVHIQAPVPLRCGSLFLAFFRGGHHGRPGACRP